jgi:hypothetical protein
MGEERRPPSTYVVGGRFGGYPLVGLRPRRARLRFTRQQERTQKGLGSASPNHVPTGKNNCRWPSTQWQVDREF